MFIRDGTKFFSKSCVFSGCFDSFSHSLYTHMDAGQTLCSRHGHHHHHDAVIVNTLYETGWWDSDLHGGRTHQTRPSHNSLACLQDDSLSIFVGQSEYLHGDATHQRNHQTQSWLTIHVCRKMMTFMEVKVTKGITTPSHDSLSMFGGQWWPSWKWKSPKESPDPVMTHYPCL